MSNKKIQTAIINYKNYIGELIEQGVRIDSNVLPSLFKILSSVNKKDAKNVLMEFKNIIRNSLEKYPKVKLLLKSAFMVLETANKKDTPQSMLKKYNELIKIARSYQESESLKDKEKIKELQNKPIVPQSRSIVSTGKTSSSRQPPSVYNYKPDRDDKTIRNLNREIFDLKYQVNQYKKQIRKQPPPSIIRKRKDSDSEIDEVINNEEKNDELIIPGRKSKLFSENETDTDNSDDDIMPLMGKKPNPNKPDERNENNLDELEDIAEELRIEKLANKSLREQLNLRNKNKDDVEIIDENNLEEVKDHIDTDIYNTSDKQLKELAHLLKLSKQKNEELEIFDDKSQKIVDLEKKIKDMTDKQNKDIINSVQGNDSKKKLEKLLKSKNDEIKSKNDEIKRKINENKRKTNEIRKYKSRLDVCLKKLDKKPGKQHKKLNRNEQDIYMDEQNKKIIDLNKIITKLKNDKDNFQPGNLEEKDEGLRDEINILKKDLKKCNNLEKKCANALIKCNEMNKKLNTEINKLKSENQLLLNMIDENKGQNDKIKILEKMLKENQEIFKSFEEEEGYKPGAPLNLQKERSYKKSVHMLNKRAIDQQLRSNEIIKIKDDQNSKLAKDLSDCLDEIKRLNNEEISKYIKEINDLKNNRPLVNNNNNDNILAISNPIDDTAKDIKINQLNNDLSLKEVELINLKNIINKGTSENNKLKEENKNLNIIKNRMKNSGDKTFSELKSMNNKLNNDYNELKRKYQKILSNNSNDVINNLSNINNKLNTTLKQKNEQLEKLNSAINNLNKANNNNFNMYNQKIEIIKDLNKKLNDMNNNNKNLNNQIIKLKNDWIDKTKPKINKMIAEFKNHDDMVNRKHSIESSKLNQKIQELSNIIEKYEISYQKDKRNDLIANLTNENNNLRNNIQNNNNNNKNIIEKQKSKINELQEQLKNINNKPSISQNNLNNVINNQKLELNNLKDQYKKHTEAIDEYKYKLELENKKNMECMATIKRLTSTAKINEKELDALRGNKNIKKQSDELHKLYDLCIIEKKNLKEKLKKINRELDDYENIKKELENIKKELEKCKKELEEYKNKYQSCLDLKNTLKESTELLKKREINLKRKVLEYKTKFTSDHKEKINNLKNKIDMNDKDLESILNDNNNKNNEIEMKEDIIPNINIDGDDNDNNYDDDDDDVLDDFIKNKYNTNKKRNYSNFLSTNIDNNINKNNLPPITRKRQRFVSKNNNKDNKNAKEKLDSSERNKYKLDDPIPVNYVDPNSKSSTRKRQKFVSKNNNKDNKNTKEKLDSSERNKYKLNDPIPVNYEDLNNPPPLTRKRQKLSKSNIKKSEEPGYIEKNLFEPDPYKLDEPIPININKKPRTKPVKQKFVSKNNNENNTNIVPPDLISQDNNNYDIQIPKYSDIIPSPMPREYNNDSNNINKKEKIISKNDEEKQDLPKLEIPLLDDDDDDIPMTYDTSIDTSLNNNDMTGNGKGGMINLKSIKKGNKIPGLYEHY